MYTSRKAAAASAVITATTTLRPTRCSTTMTMRAFSRRMCRRCRTKLASGPTTRCIRPRTTLLAESWKSAIRWRMAAPGTPTAPGYTPCTALTITCRTWCGSATSELRSVHQQIAGTVSRTIPSPASARTAARPDPGSKLNRPPRKGRAFLVCRMWRRSSCHVAAGNHSAQQRRHVLRAFHQSQRPVRRVDEEVGEETNPNRAGGGDGQRQAHCRPGVHGLGVDGLAHQHGAGAAHVVVEADHGVEYADCRQRVMAGLDQRQEDEVLAPDARQWRDSGQ